MFFADIIGVSDPFYIGFDHFTLSPSPLCRRCYLALLILIGIRLSSFYLWGLFPTCLLISLFQAKGLDGATVSRAKTVIRSEWMEAVQFDLWDPQKDWEAFRMVYHLLVMIFLSASFRPCHYSLLCLDGMTEMQRKQEYGEKLINGNGISLPDTCQYRCPPCSLYRKGSL